MMPAPHPDSQHTSRTDAIAAGLLIEVPTRLSGLFHLPHPVAVTAPAWFDTILWDAAAEAGKPTPSGQSETVRMTDLLWAASAALHQTGLPGTPPGTVVAFQVLRVPPTGPELRSLRTCLTLTLARGDLGETVATIDHKQHPVAGEFRVPGMNRSWRAVRVHADATHVWPIVAADTLDAMLSAIAAADPAVDFMLSSDGVVHLWRTTGDEVTELRPDRHQHYDLRSLIGLRFDWFHR